MSGTLSVSDVFNRVKRTFGDEAAVQVTEDDIIRWINDAQREAVMQNEGLLQTVGYLSTTADTKEYTLPADLFTLHHVYLKDTDTGAYYALRWLPLVQFTEYVDGWDGNSVSAIPLVYTQQQSGQILIYPPPQASVANGVKLVYSRYAEDVVDSSSVLDLPPYFHTYIVNFCLMQAYEMDEDWESAQNKAQQVQGDLDFNNNRQFWFGRETYPTVSTKYEDQEFGDNG
jgi:hypothetical protein